MLDVHEGLADRLKDIMREGGRKAIKDLGGELASLTIASIPIGDPHLDPNPEYSLRDHVHVRAYRNTVSVTVEGEYAVRQHESLSLDHPRGGYPKFLERNAVIIAVQLEGKIAGELRRRFNDGRNRTVTSPVGAGKPNS